MIWETTESAYQLEHRINHAEWNVTRYVLDGWMAKGNAEWMSFVSPSAHYKEQYNCSNGAVIHYSDADLENTIVFRGMERQGNCQ